MIKDIVSALVFFCAVLFITVLLMTGFSHTNTASKFLLPLDANGNEIKRNNQ
jgi:hypothetical protein